MSMNDDPRRLSPEAIHALMQRLDIGVNGLAHLTGTRRETIHDWLSGKRLAPLWLHPFLAAISVPAARQLAERTADDAKFRSREAGVAA